MPIPLVYDPPPPLADSLYQGEVLGGVVVYRVLEPPEIISVPFPLVIVLHNDCDLAQDFASRSAVPAGQTVDESEKRIIPQVLFAALYEAERLKARFPGSELRKQAMQNQNERYHQLAEAPIAATAGAERLPEFLIDFRWTQAAPPATLYSGIQTGAIRRVARLPLPFMNDLIYRCFTYLGRMSIPDA